MKPDMTLLPPDAIVAMADVMTRANTPEKHKDAKWKRMTPEEHIAAALRHIFAWLGGEKLDPELGTSHLANGSVRLSMALAREIGHSATASSDSAEGSREAAAEPWWCHQDKAGWEGSQDTSNPEPEFKVGDRVVLISRPELQGTILEFDPPGAAGFVYVTWGDTPNAKWLHRTSDILPAPAKTLDDFTPVEWDMAAARSKDIWAETKV